MDSIYSDGVRFHSVILCYSFLSLKFQLCFQDRGQNLIQSLSYKTFQLPMGSYSNKNSLLTYIPRPHRVLGIKKGGMNPKPSPDKSNTYRNVFICFIVSLLSRICAVNNNSLNILAISSFCLQWFQLWQRLSMVLSEEQRTMPG